MSRKIKFRAWDKVDKEYRHDIDIALTLEGEIYAVWAYHPQKITSNIYIIEQYTGLKDKNGKKIYEGDIVKFTGRVAKDESTLYKVVWDDFLTGYDLINLERSKADVGYLNKYNIKEHFEVIGNIHENSELLEDENEPIIN